MDSAALPDPVTAWRYTSEDKWSSVVAAADCRYVQLSRHCTPADCDALHSVNRAAHLRQHSGRPRTAGLVL